jgi:hypothetical protein
MLPLLCCRWRISGNADRRYRVPNAVIRAQVLVRHESVHAPESATATGLPLPLLAHALPLFGPAAPLPSILVDRTFQLSTRSSRNTAARVALRVHENQMTTARLSGGGEYLMNGVARRPHRYKVRFVNHAGQCTPGDQPCKSWRGVGKPGHFRGPADT